MLLHLGFMLNMEVGVVTVSILKIIRAIDILTMHGTNYSLVKTLALVL